MKAFLLVTTAFDTLVISVKVTVERGYSQALNICRSPLILEALGLRHHARVVLSALVVHRLLTVVLKRS
jgi:hypothetical protein